MFRRSISWIIIITFVFSLASPPAQATNPVLDLPAPGTMVNLSPAYQPVIIKGLTVHKDNPFLFDFIVDVGQDKMSGEPLKKEGEKLIKYFLASLAIPDKDVWVNLSPYEKDRMIPGVLGQTDMGRDLLEQDYILKQVTASLIYPERDLGKKFWDTVYTKSQQMYGTTQIPVNTFNKVWIMADRAEVFERNQTAFVVDAHLKVMLEEDYLALQKHNGIQSVGNATHSIASQITRKIVLPELEKEINTGKNFANLRQIYNSVILAAWYKKNLQRALLSQIYADKAKVQGINLNDPTVKQQIYEQYLEAYKKGVFNYIKDDISAASGPRMPRKYFSGGITRLTPDLAMTTNVGKLKSALVGVALVVFSTFFSCNKIEPGNLIGTFAGSFQPIQTLPNGEVLYGIIKNPNTNIVFASYYGLGLSPGLPPIYITSNGDTTYNASYKLGTDTISLYSTSISTGFIFVTNVNLGNIAVGSSFQYQGVTYTYTQISSPKFMQAETATGKKYWIVWEPSTAVGGSDYIMVPLVDNAMASTKKVSARSFTIDAAMTVEEAEKILQGKKILVVDDTPKVYKEILETYGMIVETAENGAEALKLLEAGKHFDLILSGLKMRYIDGEELAKRIRLSKMTFANEPILIQTVDLKKTEEQTAKESGVKEISKFITHQELLIDLAKLYQESAPGQIPNAAMLAGLSLGDDLMYAGVINSQYETRINWVNGEWAEAKKLLSQEKPYALEGLDHVVNGYAVLAQIRLEMNSTMSQKGPKGIISKWGLKTELANNYWEFNKKIPPVMDGIEKSIWPAIFRKLDDNEAQEFLLAQTELIQKGTDKGKQEEFNIKVGKIIKAINEKEWPTALDLLIHEPLMSGNTEVSRRRDLVMTHLLLFLQKRKSGVLTFDNAMTTTEMTVEEAEEILKGLKILVVGNRATARDLNWRVHQVIVEGTPPGHGPALMIVEAARSGNEALKLLDAEKFDLILSDWQIPGMNAEELAGKIRRSEKNYAVPMLIQTPKEIDPESRVKDVSLFINDDQMLIKLAELYQQSQDATMASILDEINVPEVREFVGHEAKLLTPDHVVFVNLNNIEAIRAQARAQGITFPTDESGEGSNSYSTEDTARSVPMTLTSSRDPNDAGNASNWIDSRTALEDMLPVIKGSQKGKTMYVITYVAGPKDHPTGKPGVQVTDSLAVVLAYYALYNEGEVTIGKTALDLIAKRGGKNFVKISHSTGNLDTIKRTNKKHWILQKSQFEQQGLDFDTILPKLIEKGYVTEDRRVNQEFTKLDDEFQKWFPGYKEDQFKKIETILLQSQHDERAFILFMNQEPDGSGDIVDQYGIDIVRLFGSEYGGNGIGAKKFASVRLALLLSILGTDTGTSHSFKFILEDRKTHETFGVKGSFPSFTGKTNMSLLELIDSFTDKYKIWMVSDDILQTTYREEKIPDGVPFYRTVWDEAKEKFITVAVTGENRVHRVARDINPEYGLFMVAPGINSKELKRAVEAIKKGGYLSINLAYKFRINELGQRVAAEQWWEKNDKPLSLIMLDVAQEFVSVQEGKLVPKSATGWYDWKKKPLRDRLKGINIDDIKTIVKFEEAIKAAILALPNNLKNKLFQPVSIEGASPDDLEAIRRGVESIGASADELAAIRRGFEAMGKVMTGNGNELAHPNSRITIRIEKVENWIGNASQLPEGERPKDWNNPYGQNTDLEYYGGRLSGIKPLITVMPNRMMGLLHGFFMRAAATAAEEGKPGQEAFDIEALRPFMVGSEGVLAEHRIDRLEWLGQDAPVFAYVNVFKRFRKPDGTLGDIIWPGYKDNSRHVIWIKDLMEGKIPRSEYRITPIGIIPTANASLFNGLNLSLEEREQLTEFNEEEWRNEVKLWIKQATENLKMDLPDELRRELEKLAEKLGVDLPPAWKNALPWEEMQRRKGVISQVNREFKFDQIKGLNTVAVKDIMLNFIGKPDSDITETAGLIIKTANNPQLTLERVDSILDRVRELNKDAAQLVATADTQITVDSVQQELEQFFEKNISNNDGQILISKLDQRIAELSNGKKVGEIYRLYEKLQVEDIYADKYYEEVLLPVKKLIAFRAILISERPETRKKLLLRLSLNPTELIRFNDFLKEKTLPKIAPDEKAVIKVESVVQDLEQLFEKNILNNDGQILISKLDQEKDELSNGIEVEDMYRHYKRLQVEDIYADKYYEEVLLPVKKLIAFRAILTSEKPETRKKLLLRLSSTAIKQFDDLFKAFLKVKVKEVEKVELDKAMSSKALVFAGMTLLGGGVTASQNTPKMDTIPVSTPSHDAAIWFFTDPKTGWMFSDKFDANNPKKIPTEVGTWSINPNQRLLFKVEKVNKNHYLLIKKDNAMAAINGGIDLNTSNGMQWKVTKDGNGVEMNIDPAMIEQIKEHGIESLSPVILKISPVTNLWHWAGIQEPQ